MDEKFLREAFAEVLQAQAEALALVVSAVSRQLDVGQLHVHLQQAIGAARATGKVSALGVKQATLALAAVEAEIHLRKMDGNPTEH
jgi:hypothetical protein